MRYPPVAVLVVTYDRPQEIRKTIIGLEKHLSYPGHIHWHIADDGTHGHYIDDICRDFPDFNFTNTRTERLGWGGNVNLALAHLKEDFIFLIEDDYVAKAPIRLRPGVELLTYTDMNAVRYDGLSGHLGLNLWVREFKNDQGTTIDYLEIDAQRSTHLNLYSNRPHLRHRRFSDLIGPYMENHPLGVTEENYAHRVRAAQPTPGVAILANGISRAFLHIGKTRQGTEKDIHT